MTRERGHPVFAWAYDRLAAAEERGGMADHRREQLAAAAGSVVEIGAGTGLNFRHYPPAVTRLVATEPDPYMLRRARVAARTAPVPVEVLRAPAERLPFGDGEFDVVVSTLVLCSVRDPAVALAEILRVLKPGGAFLFLEHVRSENPTHARWQDRLERPWGWVAAGCHPNRDTVAAVERAGFRIASLRRFPFGPLQPARPHVSGTATAPE
ncbi:MAG: class I SAM-dependent methyltransferase [Actinomycetota bacterium]